MKYFVIFLGLLLSIELKSQIKFHETYRFNPSCNACDGVVIIGISGLYTPYYAYLTEIGSKAVRYGPFYGSGLTIDSLCAKSYLLEISDACGCYGKYYFNLNSGVLNANVIPTDATCTSNGAITINFNISNDYTVYYRKSDQPNEIRKDYNKVASAFISDLSPGLYYIRIVDINGCEKYTSINIASKSFTVNNAILNASCNTSNGNLHFSIVGGSAPYRYEWYGPKNNNDPFVSTMEYDIPQLPAGVYTVIIRDSKNCTFSATYTINTINSINPVFTSGFADCDGINGYIDILSSGAFLPYLVEYSGQGHSGKLNVTSTSSKIRSLRAGTYKIIITDSRGCKVENNVEVKNGAPWIQLESIARDNCSGDGAFTATIFRFTKFILYGPDGKPIGSPTTGNGGSAPYFVNKLMGGFYKAVIEYNGCIKTYEFEIPSNGPTSVVVSQIPINCVTGDKGLITLKITGGKGPYKVQYRHESEVGHSVLRDFLGPDAFVVTSMEGYYYICVIDANGCTTLIKVKAEIKGGVEIIETSTKPSTCYQANGSFNVKLTKSTYPYLIQLRGPVSKDFPIFDTVYTITDLLPGDYLITFIDGNNCKVELSFHIFDESNDIVDPTKLSLLKGSGESILIYNDLVTNNYYVWGISFCRGSLRIDSILGEGISNIFYYGKGNSDDLLPNLNKNNTYLWCKSYSDELKRGCSKLRYLNGPPNLPCNNSTNNINTLDDIKLFPNPSTDIVNIDMGEIQFKTIEFELVNSTGQTSKIIPSKISDKQFQLDLTKMPKGMYFISIKVDQRNIGIKKFVII